MWGIPTYLINILVLINTHVFFAWVTTSVKCSPPSTMEPAIMLLALALFMFVGSLLGGEIPLFFNLSEVIKFFYLSNTS